MVINKTTKAAYLLLFTMALCFSHQVYSEESIWSKNNVPENIAQSLSAVGITTSSNWKHPKKDGAALEDSFATQVFDDGFKHLNYFVRIDRFFMNKPHKCSSENLYTLVCFREDRVYEHMNGIKSQITMILDSYPNATFIISLKPSYKNLLSKPGEVLRTRYLSKLEGSNQVRAAYIELWKIIASIFSDIPKDNLVFNLLNEPEWENSWNAKKDWMGFSTTIIDEIRSISPQRTILVEGIKKSLSYVKGSPSDLIDKLDRDNLVYGFHYYHPYDWTHQDRVHKTKGESWKGIGNQPLPSLSLLKENMNALVDFSLRKGVPVLLSEVGVNGSCNNNGPNHNDRAKYMSVVYDSLIPFGVGITWYSLEDTSPYKRNENDCYQKTPIKLIPETKLFKALRLKPIH